MWTRRKKRTPSRTVIQIVTSKREGDKVKQKVIRHVGTARNETEIEELEKLAEIIKADIIYKEKRGAVLVSPEELRKAFLDSRAIRKKQKNSP